MLTVLTSPKAHDWYSTLRSPDGQACCTGHDCERAELRENSETQQLELNLGSVWVPVDWDEVSPLGTVFLAAEGTLTLTLVEDPLTPVFAGSTTEIVLREATRRAGVVPNAAYRHFASRRHLLEAVRSAALSELANAMEAEIAKVRAAYGPVKAYADRLAREHDAMRQSGSRLLETLALRPAFSPRSTDSTASPLVERRWSTTGAR